jgi:rare lipoprotein A (peptidoglycan hydrolase)
MHVLQAQELGEESYGIASFYSNSFYAKKTANQELLKRNTFTAARSHQYLQQKISYCPNQ